MQSNKVTFQNQIGQTLSAKLELPANQLPVAFAIFAHCFTCNKNLLAVRNISRALNQAGYAVLRFDFTGLGESEGEFEETDFSSNIGDLIAAAEFLAANFEAPSLLIGHSLGGAAVLFAASQLDSIMAVATIGAPSNPAHVSHLFKSSLAEIEKDGRAKVNIGGRDFFIKRDFVDDLNKQNPQSVVKNLKKPLLIMHSPQDTTVGIENAAEIYSAAWHPKSFVSLDGADHLLSHKRDSEYAGKVIATWVKRYLEFDNKTKLKSKATVAVRTFNDSFTTEIIASGHSLIADEPAEVGGNEFGPTPYDLLTASLGACTSMTLQMYAKRKGWDLKEAVVHLNHNKDYASDCDDCENPSALLDHFERKIELRGNLDEKQKSQLMQIADKCPVHKTLHSEVKIITTLLGDS